MAIAVWENSDLLAIRLPAVPVISEGAMKKQNNRRMSRDKLRFANTLQSVRDELAAVKVQLSDIRSMLVGSRGFELRPDLSEANLLALTPKKPTKRACYFTGIAMLSPDQKAVAERVVQWNSRFVPGKHFVIDENSNYMRQILEVASPRPDNRWYVGTLAIYAAILTFLDSDYEIMQYGVWDLVRNPSVEQGRWKGLCHCSVGVSVYEPTEWELHKQNACTKLLDGLDVMEWDQVMGTYACLDRDMAKEIVDDLQRGGINPLARSFWLCVEEACQGRFYSDMLLECYTMLSRSNEVGNVFDRIEITSDEVGGKRPWIHFNGNTTKLIQWISSQRS